MSDHEQAPMAGGGHAAPPPSPSDERNPALLDAEQTFVVTLLGSALFIGAVFVFIL